MPLRHVERSAAEHRRAHCRNSVVPRKARALIFEREHCIPRNNRRRLDGLRSVRCNGFIQPYFRFNNTTARRSLHAGKQASTHSSQIIRSRRCSSEREVCILPALKSVGVGNLQVNVPVRSGQKIDPLSRTPIDPAHARERTADRVSRSSTMGDEGSSWPPGSLPAPSSWRRACSRPQEGPSQQDLRPYDPRGGAGT
jgi:hypothetical protein